MEKLMFKRIELWVVMILLVIAFCVAVVFGAMVRSVAQGKDRFGAVGRAAYALSAVPSALKDMLTGGDLAQARLVVKEPLRFPDQAGWTFDRSDPSNLPDGYVLFSRYDGDVSHHVVELLDIQSGEVVHRIDINSDILLEGADETSALDNFGGWNSRDFRAIHPLAFANGDLAIKDHLSPMVRMDACGGRVWMQDDDLYHHSSEFDANGVIWTTTHIEPTAIKGLDATFYDNGIAAVTPEGELTYERSLTDVFLKSGLGNWLFAIGPFADDPMHLNDVQPTLNDGPFWKKGDVFLSLRHLSMIILFRPSSDEIIWMKRGPWTSPHDVDIIDDHTIGVYSNNTMNLGVGNRVVGDNEVLLYDFATDTVRSPYKDIFVEHDIRTPSEGLFSILPGGHLFVEESDAGRTLMFSPEGKLVASNVNRASDGKIYHLGWSRFVDRQPGDQIRDAMAAQGCDTAG